MTSPGAKVLVRTLKKYGMLLADGGTDTLTAEREDLPHAEDPALTWSGLLAYGDLGALKITDFAVVDYGSPASPGGNCTVLTDPLSAFLH